MGVVTGILGLLLAIWDFVTYPVYFLIDRPWRTTRYISLMQLCSIALLFVQFDNENPSENSEHRSQGHHHQGPAVALPCKG